MLVVVILKHDNIIDFFFPASRVVHGLHVRDIRHHDHPICFAEEVPIEPPVAYVHAHEIPDLEPDLVALHLEQLAKVVGCNRCFLLHQEPVSDEPVHY